MDNFINNNGRKLRTGHVLKLEISRALGLNHRYVWYKLINNNEVVRKRLDEIGYSKMSHFVSRKAARFLAKHFDVYIEGINEEDKEFADNAHTASDNNQD